MKIIKSVFMAVLLILACCFIYFLSKVLLSSAMNEFPLIRSIVCTLVSLGLWAVLIFFFVFLKTIFEFFFLRRLYQHKKTKHFFLLLEKKSLRTYSGNYLEYHGMGDDGNYYSFGERKFVENMQIARVKKHIFLFRLAVETLKGLKHVY